MKRTLYLKVLKLKRCLIFLDTGIQLLNSQRLVNVFIYLFLILCLIKGHTSSVEDKPAVGQSCTCTLLL